MVIARRERATIHLERYKSITKKDCIKAIEMIQEHTTNSK